MGNYVKNNPVHSYLVLTTPLFSLKTTKITRWNNHFYQYSQNWRGAYRGADNKKESKMPCHLLFIYRESLIFITDSYWIKKIMNLTNSKRSKPL